MSSEPKRSYTNSAGNKSTAGESTNRGLFDFGIILLGDTDAFGWCPICFSPLDYGGATNEHILTNTEHKAIFDCVMDEGEYNQDWNLIQTHGRCNESKGTRGLFATWRARKPPSLNDDQYKTLISLLDIFEAKAKSSIGHFPKGEYKAWAQYIFEIVMKRSRTSVEKYTNKS